MKHKTAELTGALLDAAVAKAQGLSVTVETIDDGSTVCLVDSWIEGCERCIGVESGANTTSWLYAPSTSWAQGGPIIERERIETSHAVSDWSAMVGYTYKLGVLKGCESFVLGPTPLIAAMRAYVAAKLGAEVDL